MGAQGPAGPQGATGAQGPTGPAGAVVPPLVVIGSLSLGDLVPSAAIRTFSQRVDVPQDAGGGSAGKTQVSAIQISRDTDVSSPMLSLAAARQDVTPTAQIVLAGGALTISLTKVLLAQVSTDSSQDGVPVEKLTLSFEKETWTYTDGGSSTTVTYDPGSEAGSGSGGGPVGPTFVFFGQGVDPTGFPTQTPFTKLILSLTTPTDPAGGGISGKTAFSPLALVTGVTGQTLNQIGAALRQTITTSVTAHVTAIDSNLAIVDRLRYQMQNVRVNSVAIDTTAAGALQDTVGLNLSKITWVAQSLTGGPDVTATWNILGGAPVH